MLFELKIWTYLNTELHQNVDRIFLEIGCCNTFTFPYHSVGDYIEMRSLSLRATCSYPRYGKDNMCNWKPRLILRMTSLSTELELILDLV